MNNIIVIYTFTYNFKVYKLCYNTVTKELLLKYDNTTLKLLSSQCVDIDNPQNIPIIPPSAPSNTPFNFRGEWLPNTTYNAGDLVRYNCSGSSTGTAGGITGSYVCYVDGTINVVPTITTNWYLLVKDGVIKYFENCQESEPETCDCSYEYEIFKNDSTMNTELTQFYNIILNGKAQNSWLSISNNYQIDTSTSPTKYDIKFNTVENMNTQLFSYNASTFKTTFLKPGIFRINYNVYYSTLTAQQFQVTGYLTGNLLPQSKKITTTSSCEHTFLIKVPLANSTFNLYYEKSNITYSGIITIESQTYINIEYIGLLY